MLLGRRSPGDRRAVRYRGFPRLQEEPPGVWSDPPAPIPAQYSIILGVLGDAYPPIEAEVGATRLLLRELIQAQRAFHVVTKGDTVCRDVDLLAPYARCCVHISLCTVDENALARLDPGAPSALTRLRVVEHLRKEGVPVEVKAAPWIPGVTDPDALVGPRTVRRAGRIRAAQRRQL